MSTYDSLDTLHKAILFHNVFMEDIPKLTAFVNHLCEQDNLDNSLKNSSSRIKTRLRIYGDKIFQDGQLFACMFFNQDSFPFTIYCLKLYQAQLNESCPLNQAINTLFTQTKENKSIMYNRADTHK